MHRRYFSKTMILMIFSLFDLSFTWGKTHKNLSAHQHGVVNLSLVIEGKNILVELKAPAESLLGFEHLPKTAKEKEQWSWLQNKWKNEFKDIITLDPLLNCQPKESEIQMVFMDVIHKKDKHGHGHANEQGHSAIEAEAVFSCGKEIRKTSLAIRMKKLFLRVKEVHLNLIPSSGNASSKVLKGEIEKVEI